MFYHNLFDFFMIFFTVVNDALFSEKKYDAETR